MASHLADYLSRKRAEVHAMILTEYDEERRRALDRQHGYDEGVEDGIEKGIEQGIEHPAERLRAAGCDEETIRIVLGSKPAE